MASINVYQIVTDRIITDLSNGIIPWKKPWSGTKSGAFNRITKRPYSLLNQMLLGQSGEYATFKQWSSLNGRIKKGEKSKIVTFWKMYPIEEVNDKGEKVKKVIPLLKYYNVFHISQVEGVEPLPQEEIKNIEPLEEAERVLQEYVSREGIHLENLISDRAYYSPILDKIHLPLAQQFDSAEAYAETAFHEAVHSTGHKTRLARFDDSLKLAAFGSEDYSKEELTAELGSAFLMNLLGIETPQTARNNSAYIQSWLRVLKNDNKFIISASSKAEKAVKYILNETEQTEEEAEQ